MQIHWVGSISWDILLFFKLVIDHLSPSLGNSEKFLWIMFVFGNDNCVLSITNAIYNLSMFNASHLFTFLESLVLNRMGDGVQPCLTHFRILSGSCFPSCCFMSPTYLLYILMVRLINLGLVHRFSCVFISFSTWVLKIEMVFTCVVRKDTSTFWIACLREWFIYWLFGDCDEQQGAFLQKNYRNCLVYIIKWLNVFP